jgi:hypothetical protein
MHLVSLKQFHEHKTNKQQVSSTHPLKYSAQVIGVNFTKVKRDINGTFDDTVLDSLLQITVTI